MTVYRNYEDVKSRHANTAQIFIDNELVAECMSISVRESGGTDGTYTVGDAKPWDHTHNRWQCTAQIQRVIFKEGAMEKYTMGGSSLLDLPTFTIQAVDEIDGAPLFTLTGCTLSDRSTNVQANQRILSDVSILALDCLDASGNSGGGRGVAGAGTENPAVPGDAAPGGAGAGGTIGG